MPQVLFTKKFSSSSTVETVENGIRNLETYGRFTGSRWPRPSPDRRWWHVAWHGFLCFLISAWLVLGISMILISTVPHPSEGSDRSIDFDTPAVFAFTMCLFYVNEWALFVGQKYAGAVLSRPNGFYAQHHELMSDSDLTYDDARGWRSYLITKTCWGIFLYLLTCILTGLYCLGGITDGFPIRFDRMGKWIPLPDTVNRAMGFLAGVIGSIYGTYHDVVFHSLCRLTRLHFSRMCKNIESERAEDFTAHRVAKYQTRYSRLASLAECLDDAFKHSCFSQLVLFVFTACMNLFCLTRSGTRPVTVFALVYWLLAISSFFFHTVAAAILLRSESQQPKKLLRLWFMRHEKWCEENGRFVDAVSMLVMTLWINSDGGHRFQTSRNALSSLMQWIAAEDVGLTVSSIAKFDAPLLLNIFSVVVTYFLVILQFANPQPVDLGALSNLTQNISAFCQQFYSRQ